MRAETMADKPDGKRWELSGRWIGSLTAIILILAIGFALWWSSRGPSVVGVWKGTDASAGHEHYFEFHKDGTLVFWDRDRKYDGTFSERPRFRGTYSVVDPQ